jgi:hypothetical protein
MRQYQSTTTKNRFGLAKLGSKFAMRILMVTLLLSVVLPAYGSIIFFSGDVTVVSPPASLLPGALTSNTAIYGFSEQQGVLLSSPVNAALTSPGTWICCAGLPGGTVAAGTTVNSYLLYASPVTDEDGLDYRDFQGSITFSPGEKIVGILLGYENLANTDALLGAPGTTYPPAGFKLGGLEQYDTVIISSNLQSVYVDFHVAVGGDDMIRILTETPEPADFVLLGSGLLALALCSRRLRLRRASRQA